MANGSDFALPGNGIDVVRKVIHAYVLCGDKEVSLKEVAAKAGMDPTQVSRNNGFLGVVGVIEGGQKKKLTAQGKKLGIAISHDDKETIATTWRELVEATPKLKSIVDMVRVQGGVSAENLPSKVAALFGLPGGRSSTTTAVGCVIDVLKDAELLGENNGRVTASVHTSNHTENPSIQANETASRSLAPQAITPSAAGGHQGARVGAGLTPLVPIHINIELHLPATAEKSVYDAIFKSIRENLMETGDGISDQA